MSANKLTFQVDYRNFGLREVCFPFTYYPPLFFLVVLHIFVLLLLSTAGTIPAAYLPEDCSRQKSDTKVIDLLSFPAVLQEWGGGFVQTEGDTRKEHQNSK